MINWVNRLRSVPELAVIAPTCLRLLPDLVGFQLRGHGSAWSIPTHLTRLERLTLYGLARHQAPGSVLCEVGSYLGASACFLAAGIAELGGRLHCIDSWQNEGMAEGRRDTWNEFMHNTSKYQQVIIPHRGNSQEIAKEFYERITLLFIDGDHSYQGCHSDLESWLPFLATGGLVLLHDYGWAEGVKRAQREVVRPRVIKEGRLPNLYWAWVR